MSTTNTLSQQLLDLLATRNFHPEMMDSQGNPTDATKAKTFSFDYVSGSGKNYGTMVIVLDNDNEMKILYGDNLGKTMEGDDKNEFFDFLQHLNKKATSNRWTHTTTDISQLKHTMQGLAAIQEGLFEGYYGNRKISYTGNPTQARLRIVHSQPLGETDARYRHIEKLFVETVDGEVFKLGFRNLAGGKAMLEHVLQGGKPYDIRGCHITQMVNEIATLGRFNRASANRVLEGVTQELVTEAQAYYSSLRENLRRMSTGRGYTAYFENWHPADIGEQEELVENIKTMFIEQTLDTRIEAALPLLARIQQQGKAMKEADIFESWVNNLGEGTWELPETPEQQAKLEELMSQPLVAGPDGSNATEQLYDLIGDDVLFDIIADIADTDPDANIWDSIEVKDRLTELGIELPEPTEEEPVDAEAEPAQEPAPADAEQMAPVSEQLNAMRKAAGLPVVEGTILDESGETLQHILDRFKNEVKRFKAGEDLDNDLYDALFDYYASSGEMPYGTMKARNGDPYEWISQRLDQDLGGLGFRDMDEGVLGTLGGAVLGNALGGPVGAAVGSTAGQELTKGGSSMIEGTCNATMEGEYCPEHGLSECGTVAGGMAPVVMGEEAQLNEFLVKAGMPVKDVLALNLFQDFDPVEGAAAQFAEFAEEPMWQQVVRKYAPIANMLKKKLLAQKRPLTDAEAEAVEQTWYDGSDAYDDVEIEYLVDIYDQQIDTLEALLAGNLTDEEFFEQGVAEGDQQAFVNKHHDDPINYNGAITGSYYESKEGDAMLARIKSLALLK